MAHPLDNMRTLSRSFGLLRGFLHEQSTPALFYGPLARDTVDLLEVFTDLDGALVADVGSGPVQFAEAFASRGSRYVGLEIDRDTLATTTSSAGVIALGQQLPFADDALDVVLSSNVLEHVPVPEDLADELVRVCRPGGVVFLSYTLWYSPWGGHETSPWHFLGGQYARRRYERTHGRPPKNVFGESMFAATMARGLAWSRNQSQAEVLFAGPRYAPRWLQWVTHVPGLREVVGWNLLLILRKHDTPD